MSKLIYIYRVYFPKSDKCYVGQTNDLDNRLPRHLNADSLVGNALRKYDDWQWSILHTCKDRDVANTLEIEEIRNFNSVAPNGYNLTHGGEAGIPSEETKEKMRQSHVGKKPTLGKHWKRAPLSEKTKAKMSQSAEGNQNAKGNQNTKGKHWKLTEETKAKMIGNQNAKGNRWKHTKDSRVKIIQAANNPITQYKKLKTRLKNLKLQIAEDCPWDGT